MIYVDDYGIEKDKAYMIKLLVIMGKFHIHKKRSGRLVINFINNLNTYIYIHVKQTGLLKLFYICNFVY